MSSIAQLLQLIPQNSMIDVKFSEVFFMNAKLHFTLRLPNSPLHLMPSVVLKFNVFDLQCHIEKRLDVPIVDDLKERCDSTKDPED